MKKQEIVYVKEKIKEIWADDRKVSIRIKLALVVSFAMCFTFLFFGPFELTVSNKRDMAMTPSQVVPVMGLLSICVCLISTAILSVLKGKVFNCVITGIFALTLGGYIQGNFLNSYVSALNGDRILWDLATTDVLINCGVWIGIFLFMFIILFLLEKLWGKILLLVSGMMIAMQAVAFISLAINGALATSEVKEVAVLSKDEMFSYSKSNNNIVYVVDHLDYDYIEMILEEDPTFFDEMDGFTSYTNAMSEQMLTYPGVNHMLTNTSEIYNIEEGVNWLDLSWEQEGKNILKDLNDANYRVNLFGNRSEIFGGNIPHDLVANITYDISKIDKKIMASKLVELSVYRYIPLALKPFFWVEKGAIGGEIFKGGEKAYNIDETIYANGLENIELVEENYFKFYHFNGSHRPYTLLEKGEKSNKETDVVQQTKGSFHILFQAFEKMKELGIYEDASIIILADHGSPGYWYRPLENPNQIGLFYKPKGSINIPLKYSDAPVSHLNIPATILKNAGVPYSNYGKALDEIEEDEEITRYYYRPTTYNASGDSEWNTHEEERLLTYELKGHASQLENWKLIKNEKLEGFW